MRQHGSPGRPVVFPFMTPHIKLMMYSLGIKHTRKIPGCLRVFMITAAGKNVDMVAAPDRIQRPFIGKIGYIMTGRIKIIKSGTITCFAFFIPV